jgi:hypothetical protein
MNKSVAGFAACVFRLDEVRAIRLARATRLFALSCPDVRRLASLKTQREPTSKRRSGSTSSQPRSQHPTAPKYPRAGLAERGTPRLTADQVIRVLKQHGFALASQSGSHPPGADIAAGNHEVDHRPEAGFPDLNGPTSLCGAMLVPMLARLVRSLFRLEHPFDRGFAR